MKKISVKNLSCVFIFTIVLSLVMISGSFAADASDLANVSSTDYVSVVDSISDSGDASIVEDVPNYSDSSVDDSVNEVTDASNLGSLNEVSSYSSNDNEISSDDVSVFAYDTYTAGPSDLGNLVNNGVQSGDIIYLEDGEYYQGLTIRKNLSFIALNPGHVTFDAHSNFGIVLIYDHSSVLFEGINFVNGSASQGGAINTVDSYDSRYLQNLTLINCNFINNTARDSGGAISVGDNYNLNVINCSFLENNASRGGAIDISPITPGSINDNKYTGVYGVNIVSSIFENNTANTFGGAIYCNNTDLNLMYSYLSGNNASSGGALFFNEERVPLLNKINVSNNVIVDNNATNNGTDILLCSENYLLNFQLYDSFDLNNNWWGINNPMNNSVIYDNEFYNDNYYALSHYWTTWSNRVVLSADLHNSNPSPSTSYNLRDNYCLNFSNDFFADSIYHIVLNNSMSGKDFMVANDFCDDYQVFLNRLLNDSNLNDYEINFTESFKDKLILYAATVNLGDPFFDLKFNNSGRVEMFYVANNLTNETNVYYPHYYNLYEDTMVNTLNYQTLFSAITSNISIHTLGILQFFVNDKLCFGYELIENYTSYDLLSGIDGAIINGSLFKMDNGLWVPLNSTQSTFNLIDFNRSYEAGHYLLVCDFFKDFTTDNVFYSNPFTNSLNSTKYSYGVFEFDILPNPTNVSISTTQSDYFTDNIVHANGTLNYYNESKEYQPLKNASLVLNLMDNGDFVKNVSVMTGFNGTYSYDFVDLVEGNYTVFVSFLGNKNFTASSANTTFKVRNTQSNVSIYTSKDNYTSIEPVIVNGTLTNLNTTEVIGLANITITVIDSNNKTIAVVNTTTDAKGNYNYTFDNLTNGTYTVLVNYPGNSSVIGSNVTTTLNINKVNSTINATTDKPSYLPNESVKVNGTLRDPNGNLITNVTVTITLKNELNKTIATVNVTTDDNANYHYDFGNLTNDTYIVETVFNGNDYFLPSNSTIVFNVSLTTNGTNTTNSTSTNSTNITTGNNGTNTTNITNTTNSTSGNNSTNSTNSNDPNLNKDDDSNSSNLNNGNYYESVDGNDGAVANSVSAASSSSSVNDDSESGLDMKSTGNPLAMLLLALLAIPFGLRRKL